MGLFFFRNGTWYTWTVSLPSLWLQLLWWQIVRCFKGGLHCMSLYIAFKALNLLQVSEVFWSFICIFKSNLYVHNHVSQKAKGEISNRDAIPNRETAIQVQAMFPTKNTLTINTDDQKFNCDNANGHSQTGNWKKISASWISKTSHKNKSNEKRLETLFPRHWSNIYLHKTSFNCGFDRYKVIDCFKVQLVNWWLLLFQWCKMPFKHFYSHFDTKYHPSHANRCKFPEELSTDTVSWICILQEFLPRIKQWVDFIIL